MRSSKILILFLVGFLVFGSVGIFGYILFIKPYTNFTIFHFLKKQPSPTSKTSSNPITNPSLVDFDAALALQNAGKTLESQAAWLTWLANYPNAPKRKEAMIFLGKANMELFTSPPANSKENYRVVKGDSLDRIARKQKSNPELIQRLNNLPTINLQIGEVLFVPQLDTTLEIDCERGILILKNYGQFLKSYALLSFPHVSSQGAGAQKKAPQTTTIVDRIATCGNKRTAFGDKKYPTSERTILLRSGGNIVSAPIAEATIPANSLPGVQMGTTNSTNNAPAVVMPPGFVIASDDMKELFPFVSKETSVTIY